MIWRGSRAIRAREHRGLKIRSARPNKRSPLLLFLGISIALLSGCLSLSPMDDRRDLLSEGRGPLIAFHPLAIPIPELPFPNDSALRYDEESPTGLRLNLSEESVTQHLRQVRHHLNMLDGFGTFTPITLSFEGRIDLSTVHHQSAFLINIDPRSERYGERLPLDLGQGFFPLSAPLGWFYGLKPDPLPDNFLFPASNHSSHDENHSSPNENHRSPDENHSSPDENHSSPDENHSSLDEVGSDEGALISHYDFESDTLILRPLIPLAHKAKHAIVLTDEISGWPEIEERAERSGVYGSIRSPYPLKVSLAQADGVSQALELLGLSWDEVAFGWTFTTGAPNAPLMTLREGLYGRGRLAEIGESVTSKISEVRDTGIDIDGENNLRDHRFIMQGYYFSKLTQLIGLVLDNEGYAIQFPDVDYFVFGSFPSPQLRSAELPWAVTPEGLIEPPKVKEVPFFLSVPKEGVQGEPPFPVVLYFHGTNSSRLEGLILAQELAKQGIAMFSFDQVGHGPMVPNARRFKEQNPSLGPILDSVPRILAQLLVPERVPDLIGLPFEEAITHLEDVGLYQELALIGRWEDRNEDGIHDPAEGFFSSEPLALCGAFWQDLLDGMQAVKILRALDPLRIPPRVNRPKQATKDRLYEHFIEGDFNADGVLDIGGKGVQISSAGTSLGGIHALMMAAIEPEIEVSTPIVAGAGMIDILMRSNLRFIAEPLFLEFLGQVVVGCPDPEGDRLWVSLGNDASRCAQESLESSSIGSFSASRLGGRLLLTNQTSGEARVTKIDQRGGFSLQVPTDVGDTLTLTLTRAAAHDDDESSPVKEPQITFKARVNGAGYSPYTADFRKAAYVLQNIFDRCDPISFARQMSTPTPGAPPPVKVLMFNALGDPAVPINTGVNLANALGLLGREEAEWRPRLELLRDRNVLSGLSDPLSDDQLYDVDDVTGDHSSETLPIGPFPPISVLDGLSAIRFADVEGDHEWIAGYKRDGFYYGRYTLRQVAAYHRCSGRLILDEDPRCVQGEECALIDHLYLRAECQWEAP
jgi:hypothetical protein